MLPTPSFRDVPTLPRALVACAAIGWGCATSPQGDGTASPPGQPSTGTVQADRQAPTHTAADVAFMRGMIHHHAQAVAMARLAPRRARDPALRRLAARILNSQKTEITLMADWLRDRGEAVPALAAPAIAAAEDPAPPDSETGEIAPPGGWDAGPRMPGILTDSQMERLRAARGREFDRLFLTLMIEHHEGAVVMVDRLVRTPDGAREESVFRLASGIRADQSSEIDRMRTMLRETLFETDSP